MESGGRLKCKNNRGIVIVSHNATTIAGTEVDTTDRADTLSQTVCTPPELAMTDVLTGMTWLLGVANKLQLTNYWEFISNNERHIIAALRLSAICNEGL